MQINLIADSSVSSAPAGFTAAVEAAAAVYENAIVGDYTINIRYGWGTFNNDPDAALAGARISLGGVVESTLVDYATVKGWLTAAATLPDQQAAVASLPASSATFPNSTDTFRVSAAEEKAFGVYAGASDAINGAIGFGTGLAASDNLEGLALCEIGHALGWSTDYYGGAPSILDLYRFSSPGQREWTGGQFAYFSTDGGVSDLGNFATTFDYTLFTGPAGDAFTQVLNVLGFGGAEPAGPQISISEAYALPGAGLVVVDGAIVSSSPQNSISLWEGATELARSTPQTGDHWALEVQLSAGPHILTAVATDSAGASETSASFIVTGSGASDVYADTAADLAALTAGQIAALAQSGVTTLRSTDATLIYDSAQSAAIGAAGMIVAAPANDRAREDLANGSILVFNYGASGVLSRAVTHYADGTLDRRIYGVSGAVHGIAFAGYDVFVEASGAGVQKLFLDSQGAEVATLIFAPGGYSLYVGGQISLRRTVESGGDIDVYRYDHPGMVAGLTFDATDTLFTPSGVASTISYYEDGAYLGYKYINADRSFEFNSAALSGRSYVAFQNAVSSNSVLLGQSYDYADNSGELDIFGSDLKIISSGFSTGGSYGSASGPAEFYFGGHLNETYNLAAGAGDETLKLEPDFRTITVNGFSAQAGDVADLSALFASYSDATAAMTSSGGAVTFKDSSGDALTLTGVDPSTLSASRLGFA